MKKVKVRCFQIHLNTVLQDQLYIAYPEGNAGYDLISCLNCGQVYAVDVEKSVYIGPSIEEKLKELKCIKCQAELANTHSNYPEKYLGCDGKIYLYTRETEMPVDENSIIKEFPEIYSD